jgi:hypothetical protein
MRLWTVHPKYLDTQGLLAAWREGLLAQKVLQGRTRGYRHHPQLTRFKAHKDPVEAIAAYLRFVYKEALSRGYNFDDTKIAASRKKILLRCTRGQLLYEWTHLRQKLKVRSVERYAAVRHLNEPEANPLFRIVAGAIEPWEVMVSTQSRRSKAT